MKVKIPLIAEIEILDHEPGMSAEAIAMERLDEFREAVNPSLNYGITLYRPVGSNGCGYAKLNDVANCFD